MLRALLTRGVQSLRLVSARPASTLLARPLELACARGVLPALPAPHAARTLLRHPGVLAVCDKIAQVRTVIKFSLRKGKRKTVKAVPLRFFRLHWGGWIRTRQGRHKKMWKKSSARKRRLRQHVFCNATQSRLLDKMVTNFWKRPKYYVNDIYEPYHTREEFAITRKKPIVRN